MKSGKLLFLLYICIYVYVCNSESLEFKKVHLVDYIKLNNGVTNMLFRGNMPTNSTTFAYDELLSYMENRTITAGLKWPSITPYIIDISLNNMFDGSNFEHEQEFWQNKAHSNLGKFINWPLGLAGILPPNIYPKSVRESMVKSVWKFDKIPSRVADIRQMLNTSMSNNRPVIIYVHCTAGCDRTGEVIGSYRMTYENDNAVQMYALDTTECGRSPNYWSTSALEWYCYYLQYDFSDNLGDCVGFAKCHWFGSCKPTTSINKDDQFGAQPMIQMPSHIAPFMFPNQHESLYN